MPRTATRRPRRRSFAAGSALAAAAVLLLAALAAGMEARSFEPGTSLPDPAISDLAVSDRQTPYPPAGEERFPGRPRVLYVYVAVRGLPAEEGLSARVERSGRASLLGALLGERGVVARSSGPPRLATGGEGLSGVVRFEVRSQDGSPLPAGGYTVAVYREGREEPSAVRRFVVGS
ncbi:hypothetical protein Rxycam_00173 [Rubrobacter xylanophilus DSM 9941]|nr:hypothetical protein Rxycam_00173 [Rubrobacter xylanophilus DSM 9941]